MTVTTASFSFIRIASLGRTRVPVVHSSIRSSSTALPQGRINAVDIKIRNSTAPTQNILSPPKGTRDFYPVEQRLRNWLFQKWHTTATLFGFEEYDAPILENEELYIRKAGEEITEQLYNFVDKGGRKLSLRPEMTPSLARMILNKGKSLALPLKWYSIPQCWRYERMSRGRRREHYQWNMDVWGVDTVDAEAELLAAIVHSLKLMGLTSEDVGIKINSRKILNRLMAAVGIEESKWGPVCVLIDKLDKVPLEALNEEVEKIEVSSKAVAQLVEILKTSDLSAISDVVGNEDESVQELRFLMQLLDGHNISDWIRFDGTVVRGLAYYTGIVFEGFDRSGELRAICGGGRYDQLLQSLGGSMIPAVGFGFGDAVIVELLKMKSLLPDVQENSIDVVAFAMEDKLKPDVLDIVRQLRAENIRTDIVLGNRKPKWVLQRAERLKAELVLIVGEEEFSNGQVLIKDMVKRTQQALPKEEVVAYVKNNIQK